MNDREALLAAILAHPEEDTPRLVFADWLDEHDQPHWAALIRTECERERLREDGSPAEGLIRFLGHIEAQGGCNKIAQRVRWDRADPEVGRRLALENTTNRLRGRAATARNAAQPSGKKSGLVWEKGTHRGFQAAVTVFSGERFAKRFDALARWCPPLELTLQSYADLAPELVDRGLLRWARALNIDVHQPLFDAMCAHPNAAGVRALEMPAVDGLVHALAGSHHWSGLRVLNVPHEGITGDAAAALFSAEHLGALTTLWLCARGWTVETVDTLLRGPFRNLRELALGFGALDDDMAERLAASPALQSVRYLDLSHNRITGRGASALIASKHLKSLAVLELEGNPIRDLDRVALAGAPAGGLRAISFHGCGLQTEDVAALAASPRLSELVYLDLDYNRLNSTAVARLVANLPCAPAVVYLMGNQIAASGAKALARWAGSPGLDQLHVCRNPITGAGAEALATSATLAGLRHLCVTGITGAARTALEERFKKRVEFPT